MHIRKIKGSIKDPSQMTMREVSQGITRIMKDLNAVSAELELRGFAKAAAKLDNAADKVNAVALRFCDNLDAIPSICYDDGPRCPEALRSVEEDGDESESGGDWLENLGSLDDPRN